MTWLSQDRYSWKLLFKPMVLTKFAFIVWQTCESECCSTCFILSCSVFHLILLFVLLWPTSKKILSWFKYKITCASQARASTHQNIFPLDGCSGRHKTIDWTSIHQVNLFNSFSSRLTPAFIIYVISGKRSFLTFTFVRKVIFSTTFSA